MPVPDEEEVELVGTEESAKDDASAPGCGDAAAFAVADGAAGDAWCLSGCDATGDVIGDPSPSRGVFFIAVRGRLEHFP